MGNVKDLRPDLEDLARRLERRGEPPYDGGMEARVAKLEASMEFVQRELTDIKGDTREIKKDARADFRVLFGAIIVATLGLAGLMAKGFHWL